uniref:Uncharacterized protein n=1 Tax=Eutreptiella gymnastica TaxID=73025 RepID=A0A7S1NLG8_9EUGL
MSDYFKAAARCDITVIKNSPVPIDEKSIIEEEIKARQFDTLIQRAERDSMTTQLKDASLDKLRQREQEERMKTIRLEHKRNEALQQRQLDRQAREELDRRHNEELELQRVARAEERRHVIAQEQSAARRAAEQKNYDDVQRRLQKAVPKSVEEQAAELPADPSDLSYMERMRMEKERLGRMAKLYDGNASIKALYTDTEVPKAKAQTQLERDINARQEQEAQRLKAEMESLLQEEAEYENSVSSQRRKLINARKQEHEEWLAKYQLEEDELQAAQLKLKAQSESSLLKEHPIDVIHKQVEALFLAEQEAEDTMNDNLRFGFSHVDKLEEYMELEKEAWRDQLQMDRELAYRSQASV